MRTPCDLFADRGSRGDSPLRGVGSAPQIPFNRASLIHTKKKTASDGVGLLGGLGGVSFGTDLGEEFFGVGWVAEEEASQVGDSVVVLAPKREATPPKIAGAIFGGGFAVVGEQDDQFVGFLLGFFDLGFLEIGDGEGLCGVLEKEVAPPQDVFGIIARTRTFGDLFDMFLEGVTLFLGEDGFVEEQGLRPTGEAAIVGADNLAEFLASFDLLGSPRLFLIEIGFVVHKGTFGKLIPCALVFLEGVAVEAAFGFGLEGMEVLQRLSAESERTSS